MLISVMLPRPYGGHSTPRIHKPCDLGVLFCRDTVLCAWQRLGLVRTHAPVASDAHANFITSRSRRAGRSGVEVPYWRRGVGRENVFLWNTSLRLSSSSSDPTVPKEKTSIVGIAAGCLGHVYSAVTDGKSRRRSHHAPLVLVNKTRHKLAGVQLL
jgi:hypothetical protein